MELIKQAMELKAEILNQSFNYHKINDPHQTFFTTEYVKKFIETIDKTYIFYKSELELCESYAQYLSMYLKKANQDIFKYLKSVATEWKLKDKNITENETTLYLYVIKKFIISPISGFYLENQVKKQFFHFIKNNQLDIQLQDATVEEDATMCVDFFLKTDKLKIGMQVKPPSFFKSLKTTSKYSLQKIKEASIHYNNVIFICTLEHSRIKIAFRNKLSDKWQFLYIPTFIQIMQYSPKQVKDVCTKTFQQLEM